MAINNMADSLIHGKEQIWLQQYEKTHMKLPAIARKYSIGRDKLLKILPPPDLRCPYGCRTRLWSRVTLEEFFKNWIQVHEKQG